MELEIVRWLRERLPTSQRVTVGPGDDAAVLDWSAGTPLLVACDTIVEGLDFTFETSSPEQVGYKALAINLSDLAAMAATPVCATVSLVLPEGDSLGLCQQLIEGMLPLATRYGVDLVGGDISIWNGPLVATVNLIGSQGPHGLWCRSGASAGDSLLVTGQLGGSILGHHLNFEPRVSESLQLATDYQIKAAIDISDGLTLDVHRLASENGLRAILDLQAIPISAAAVTLAADPAARLTALEHALQDGEDFELLLVVDPAAAAQITSDERLGVQITAIGTLSEGSGLWSRDSLGSLQPLKPSGYLHGGA